MNRNNFLSVLTSTKKAQPKKAAGKMPPASLAPYTGAWTEKEAGHLMRRATFGPNQSMIDESVSIGLEATINRLFDEAKVPYDPPVRYTLDEPEPGNIIFAALDDPYVELGETWVNEPPLFDTGDPVLNAQINVSRFNSMNAWNYNYFLKPEINIKDKMWVFWHNHFVVSEFAAPLSNWQYASLLEQYAIGDFRELTKEITILPAMLQYLNGGESVREAPNENYARELLELFTVGKGELAGPGDYTTFTEQDVSEMARVLTGWAINPFVLNERLESVFVISRHDIESKTLSERFGGVTINNEGDNEYKTLIDIIFQQEAVSKHLCRKLYRYFLNSEITAETEVNIISPMAEILRASDYVVEPVIKTLLSSQHFFGDDAVGCMIKNPIDFMMSATKGLNFTNADDIPGQHFFSLIFAIFSSEMDMRIYFHPDVAGWKAYYQEPLYYRTWINTFSLPKRNQIATSFAAGGPISINGGVTNIQAVINVLDYAETLEEPGDPNLLIEGIGRHLFPKGIVQGQKDYLKEILIPGLPDFEWTVEYGEYLSDPTPENRIAIRNKLSALMIAMLEMPEFQLM